MIAPDIRFRLAEDRDRPTVRQLMIQGLGEEYPAADPDQLSELFDRYWEMAERTIFLAVQDDQVAGMIWVILAPDQVTQQSQLYIVYLTVIPPYRAQGLARRMLLHARQYAEPLGITTLRLMVRPDNPALRLYQSVGFQIHQLEMTWNWS